MSGFLQRLCTRCLDMDRNMRCFRSHACPEVAQFGDMTSMEKYYQSRLIYNLSSIIMVMPKILCNGPRTHLTSNTAPKWAFREWKRVSKRRSNDFGSDKKFK